MAPHFFTEPGGLAEIAQVRDVYAQGDLKAKMGRYHDDPEGAFRGWNDVWLDPGFKAWNVADVIDYFRVPVLAIQGHGDQYGTMAQIDVIEERSYAPVELLKLDDCGHAPQLEQSEQVLAAISDFVARLVRIEAAEVIPA
jgi:pimeloyl-ACP methyl ester carboxylesterase